MMKAPFFKSGNCMQRAYLTRAQIEAIGPLILAEIARLESAGDYAGHLKDALRRLDYPQ